MDEHRENGIFGISAWREVRKKGHLPPFEEKKIAKSVVKQKRTKNLDPDRRAPFSDPPPPQGGPEG